MARSVAAIAQGYTGFDADLNLAGLLLNKVGGAAHGTWLVEALQAAGQEAQVLGWIPQVLGWNIGTFSCCIRPWTRLQETCSCCTVTLNFFLGTKGLLSTCYGASYLGRLQVAHRHWPAVIHPFLKDDDAHSQLDMAHLSTYYKVHACISCAPWLQMLSLIIIVSFCSRMLLCRCQRGTWDSPCLRNNSSSSSSC